MDVVPAGIALSQIHLSNLRLKLLSPSNGLLCRVQISRQHVSLSFRFQVPDGVKSRLAGGEGPRDGGDVFHVHREQWVARQVELPVLRVEVLHALQHVHTHILAADLWRPLDDCVDVVLGHAVHCALDDDATLGDLLNSDELFVNTCLGRLHLAARCLLLDQQCLVLLVLLRTSSLDPSMHRRRSDLGLDCLVLLHVLPVLDRGLVHLVTTLQRNMGERPPTVNAIVLTPSLVHLRENHSRLGLGLRLGLRLRLRLLNRRHLLHRLSAGSLESGDTARVEAQLLDVVDKQGLDRAIDDLPAVVALLALLLLGRRLARSSGQQQRRGVPRRRNSGSLSVSHLSKHSVLGSHPVHRLHFERHLFQLIRRKSRRVRLGTGNAALLFNLLNLLYHCRIGLCQALNHPELEQGLVLALLLRLCDNAHGLGRVLRGHAFDLRVISSLHSVLHLSLEHRHLLLGLLLRSLNLRVATPATRELACLPQLRAPHLRMPAGVSSELEHTNLLPLLRRVTLVQQTLQLLCALDRVPSGPKITLGNVSLRFSLEGLDLTNQRLTGLHQHFKLLSARQRHLSVREVTCRDLFLSESLELLDLLDLVVQDPDFPPPIRHLHLQRVLKPLGSDRRLLRAREVALRDIILGLLLEPLDLSHLLALDGHALRPEHVRLRVLLRGATVFTFLCVSSGLFVEALDLSDASIDDVLLRGRVSHLHSHDRPKRLVVLLPVLLHPLV